jgi:hypothetical protein
MRRWVAVFVAVLALVAGACSDDDDASGSGDKVVSGDAKAAAKLVAASAGKTVEAKSARVDLTIDGVSAGQPGSALKATGKFDFDRRVGLLRMDASALTGAQATGQDATIDLVIDKSIVYMRFPLLSSLVPDAKEWLKLDLAALAKESNVPIDVDQLAQADPTQALLFLGGATDDIKKLADEELRGETVTKYEVNLDLTKAAKEAKNLLPEEQAAAFEKSLGQIGGTLPANVWLDAEGRLRRMHFDLADLPNAPAEATGSFTMDMYDFGVVVEDLTIPAADQVTDFSALLAQIAQTTTTAG